MFDTANIGKSILGGKPANFSDHFMKVLLYFSPIIHKLFL
jgi:hypothetical protein